MKYLFLWFLIACSSQPTITADPPEVPIQIARGTNGKINWSCELQELDEQHAKVRCSFSNDSDVANNACIRVSYYNEQTDTLISESNQICSGNLNPEKSEIKDAVFVKNNRKALQKCGELLDLCVMLAGQH